MTTPSIEVATDRACRVRQPPTAPSFTERQGQYLAFIDAYTRVNGRPPAEADLRRHFGVSAPSVHQMVVTLERAGLVRRRSGVARSIKVLVDPGCLPRLQPPQTVKSSVQKD
jgi:SOS-response transcriptional repressor LexA